MMRLVVQFGYLLMMMMAAADASTTATRSQKKPSTLRHRRQVLDIDTLMDIVLPGNSNNNHIRRSLKKGEKKDQNKGRDCDTGDYLTDLFHCGQGGRGEGGRSDSMSLSLSMMIIPMPMTAPPLSPPTVPTVPIPPVMPRMTSIPTTTTAIPIAPVVVVSPTTAPFAECRSQTDRSQAVLTTLRQYDPNLQAIQRGPALDWIIFQDPARIDPCMNTSRLVQRYALAVLYFVTNGPQWNTDDQWLSESSECQWSGITCNTTTAMVENISLNANNLDGTLPNELSLLSNLSTLSVFRNTLVGTLPMLWPESLLTLDVEENQLVGSPFAWINNDDNNDAIPTNLAIYRVSSNLFTGTIPTEIFLPSLTEFWIANNNLQGTIPSELGQSTSLTSMILYGNALSGNIPSTIGNLNQLKRLQAYRNQLTGTIPTELFVSTNLVELRLEQNQLAGTVPTQIGQIVNMEDLRMGENSFTGVIPTEISLLSNLAIFTANATALTGTIQDSFTNFTNLNFVDLSSNQLRGPIPSSIFNTPINYLYLSDNMITGSIPLGYAQASGLQDLYLYNNELSGTVPAINSGQLTNLTEFRVENNEISGTMPASICALQLDTLISDCGGPLPQIRCDCCNSCVTSP